MKRTDYISWDNYFMGVALLAAKRSKDPNTQVGACLVSEDKRVLSQGYNGMPNGCSDDEFPWSNEVGTENSKYQYVCHAELNAILNSDNRQLRGATLYTTLFPCNECAKSIIQSGIKKIIYYDDKYHDTLSSITARKMFDAAKVSYTKYKRENTDVSLHL